jgi:hypothetical protein
MISTRAIRWIVGSGAICLAVAAPVRWSPGRGLVAATAACADGTCCPEPKSDCITNNFVIPNYYLKAGGGPCGGDPTRPLPPP